MRLPIIYLCFSAAAAYAAGPLIDNEHVRVLVAVDQPHHKGALHRHEVNRVMIYLTAGDLDVTYQDGRIDHQHWKVHDVAWSPAGGLHTSENVGAQDLRIVEVELKQAAPASQPIRSPKFDPLVIDPAHNKRIFENDQVRVFRSSREPGSEEKMHQHVGAGRLVVLLTDMDGRMTSFDGKTSTMRGARGDAFWSDGTITHKGKNVGKSDSDMVVVEVK